MLSIWTELFAGTAGIFSVDKEAILAIVRIMAKVTSKLQVTVPKIMARHYGIKPGDEIEWVAAGDSIRFFPVNTAGHEDTRENRIKIFDQATKRLRRRQSTLGRIPKVKERGWKREDLYIRGRAD
jgi:bifunctional DNA-binding transcriptional regulator/antitoxin component of YhaV-PrlF toxin-antitoxin module